MHHSQIRARRAAFGKTDLRNTHSDRGGRPQETRPPKTKKPSTLESPFVFLLKMPSPPRVPRPDIGGLGQTSWAENPKRSRTFREDQITE